MDVGHPSKQWAPATQRRPCRPSIQARVLRDIQPRTGEPSPFAADLLRACGRECRLPTTPEKTPSDRRRCTMAFPVAAPRLRDGRFVDRRRGRCRPERTRSAHCCRGEGARGRVPPCARRADPGHRSGPPCRLWRHSIFSSAGANGCPSIQLNPTQHHQDMVENLDFVVARLHGRRSRMIEGPRLKEACGRDPARLLASRLTADRPSRSPSEFDRRLAEDLAGEIHSMRRFLPPAGLSLADWMLTRFT